MIHAEFAADLILLVILDLVLSFHEFVNAVFAGLIILGFAFRLLAAVFLAHLFAVYLEFAVLGKFPVEGTGNSRTTGPLE